MKKLLSLPILILTIVLVYPALTFAQGMMDGNQTVSQSDDGLPAEALAQAGHTAREEAEGKEVWEKLQSEELKCENLTDENFGALGEYFMGQMMGDSHESMNNMMIQMMGEAGEEEMHVALGKRMSECEPNAAMPQNMMNSGMMQMMMGGGMMGNWMNFGFAPFGWIFMILFWALIIAGIVVLIKWIAGQNKTEGSHKSALDILKERYAKGEINKKEFEERKKEIE